MASRCSNGRNRSAPKTRINMAPKRTRRSRLRQSQISENGHGAPLSQTIWLECWRNYEREESMNAQQRNFLLLVTLVAVAVTPGLGQAAAPTASIPDFSGYWVHPSIPGFEPLASGPTSLTNRSRRDGMNNILQLVGDYTNPILKPEAAAVVKKFG